MASGRDFTRDAVEGEQDALIGIQTRGGTILRGATVPPSPNDTAGREGTRRTPGTGWERSPPSPVRSGHQDWPALQGTKPAARGRLGAPELRQSEEDRNSPFRAAEGAPPGFTALATGPTLNLRPEWLSNPKGTPQRTPGENFGHGTQDARASQMGAFRPGVRNAPEEENNPALREKHRATQTSKPDQQTKPFRIYAKKLYLTYSPSAPSVRGGRMGLLTKTPSPSKAGRTVGLPCATTALARTTCSNGEETKQQ
jgi:hypothetical protein